MKKIVTILIAAMGMICCGNNSKQAESLAGKNGVVVK